MQSLMPLIPTQDNLFHDGNPLTGEQGTIVTAEHLNNEQSAIRDIQTEMLAVLAEAAITPNPINTHQLLDGLKLIIGLTGKPKFLMISNSLKEIADAGPVAISKALTNLGLGDGSALPVGVPVPYPLATPPTGWLKCNGAAFTAAQYPNLAKAYPSLKLPDLRGEFIRGWDDGRGVDANRILTSAQSDETRAHYHKSYFYAGVFRREIPLTSLDSTYEMLTISSKATALSPQDIDAGGTLIGTDDYGCLAAGNDDSRRTATELNTSTVGGAENRPRNVAFNYIVRAA